MKKQVLKHWKQPIIMLKLKRRKMSKVPCSKLILIVVGSFVFFGVCIWLRNIMTFQSSFSETSIHWLRCLFIVYKKPYTKVFIFSNIFLLFVDIFGYHLSQNCFNITPVRLLSTINFLTIILVKKIAK